MAGILDIFRRWKRQKPVAGQRNEPTFSTKNRGPYHHDYPHIIGGIESGRVDRLTASWTSTPVPPDEWVFRWLHSLKARSRDLAMNDPYMRRFVRAVRANVIGHSGPHLRCVVRKGNGTPDDAVNEAVTQSWAEWGDAENCDVIGQKSLHEIALSVATSLAIDGEAFIKFVRTSDGKFKLQMIDSARCPSDYEVVADKNGNFIKAGIEYDATERPVAYFFNVDPQNQNYYTFGGYSCERVPAADVCHVFRQEMVGARRGFPWATPSLFKLKKLKQTEDNALMAAEVGAATMGLITYKDGEGPDLDVDHDSSRERLSFSARGGSIVELPQGADFSSFNPAYPSDALAPFSKHLLRGISAGMGTSYPTAANDLSDANYSSIRAGLIEERDLWKEDQRLLVERFFKPVFREWLKLSLLRGDIVNNNGYRVPATKLSVIRRCADFHSRRWDWVDPKNDAIANREAMTSLIKSPQEIIRERGRDPDDVLAETAMWWERAKQLGVPMEAMKNAWGDKITEQMSEKDESGGKDDAGDD